MIKRVVGAFGVLTVVMSVLVFQPAAVVSATGAGTGGVVDLTDAVPATFTSTPGVEQLTVRGGPVRAPLTLVQTDTLERIVTLYTDDLGQLVFQYIPDDFLVHDPQIDGVLPTVNGSTVPPGSYRVVSEGVPGEPFDLPVEASDPIEVLGIDDVPDVSLYEGQDLPSVPTEIVGGVKPGFSDEDGYGYLETRDGTLLSVNVRLPDPAFYGPGPYPTVVQYSGYAPSRPGMPSGGDAGGMLATVFGFAYVGVNIRGTGCSGGVFDTFNAAQAADGYDVIETVARQPWAVPGEVGMMGISYSGITQLYVGATNPPNLAAITPLSVIEDPWYQQWAGGIYNSGFTKSWLASRDDEALGGAQWVKDRILGGDLTCSGNLDIRSQNIPFEDFAKSLERRPAQADARNLSLLVEEIDVPVFLTGAWQDEQTGARFGLMLDDFGSVPEGQTKFTMYNGHHNDAFAPTVMTRWFEFLSLYVDHEIPKIDPLVRLGAPVLMQDIFGVPDLAFEPDRFLEADGVTPIHGDFAGTLAAYEAESPVRVLYEVGASPDYPAHPMAPRQRWDMNFSAWPPPEAAPTTFFLGPDGTLVDAAPDAMEIDRFDFDADVLDERYFVSGDHSNINVINDWRVTPDGFGLAYETAPLPEDLVVAGEGYLDLWFRSTGTDAPIEVVLSEVYATDEVATGDTSSGGLSSAVPSGSGVPSGSEEVRVQHGLLRAAYRTIDPDRSMGTQIDHLYYAENYEPLPEGQFVNLQVPLYSVSHPFRAGSRLRIEINTPGADAPLWDFESDDFGATTHDVARGGSMASALVLPVLPGSDPNFAIPAEFADQADRPACDALRGQPCRLHETLANDTVFVSPPCDPDRFLDVDALNPFCREITWASDNDITDGYTDGHYRPAAGIRRQSAAAMAYRWAGSPDGDNPACTESPFPDIAVDHAFCGEIAWAADNGVMTGKSTGNFAPLDKIVRDQAAAVLYRLAGSPDGDDPVCTEPTPPELKPWGPFCGEVAWAMKHGVYTGNLDGTFGQHNSLRRQAAAALFHRLALLTA